MGYNDILSFPVGCREYFSHFAGAVEYCTLTLKVVCHD